MVMATSVKTDLVFRHRRRARVSSDVAYPSVTPTNPVPCAAFDKLLFLLVRLRDSHK